MKVVRTTGNPDQQAAGLDVLREFANYPHRTVVMSKHQLRNRIVITQRDALGNVIGSTERLEELDITDLNGQYTD